MTTMKIQNKTMGTAKKVFRRPQEIIKKQKEMRKTDLKGLTVGFIAAMKWLSFLAWGGCKKHEFTNYMIKWRYSDYGV